MQRLAKIISKAGVCSRRQAEVVITNGEVKVDGAVVTIPQTLVDINNKIEVSGKLINLLQTPRLWVYYKPCGVITTHQDPQGRKTVFASLPSDFPRVISIGRLDLNSEGLLLLTNNGDLARACELPKNALERVYKARCYGCLDKLLKFLSHSEENKAIIIEGIIYRPKSIKLIQTLTKNSGTNSEATISANSWFEVILQEGKNREVRRIFEFFGLEVNRLIRIRYGPFSLGNLKAGEYLEQSFSSFKKFLP